MVFGNPFLTAPANITGKLGLDLIKGFSVNDLWKPIVDWIAFKDTLTPPAVLIERCGR